MKDREKVTCKGFAVSDGTGTTAERVMRAALTQFEGQDVQITRYGRVRTVERVHEVVDEAVQTGAFIIHTLVSADMRRLILEEGRQRGVATIDLMGPLLARLTEVLSATPRAEPGLFAPFDDAYLGRVEAIRFTVDHDDGRNVHDLPQADIVLVGVSRTCKTPLSIYLGNQGWRVANVPLIWGIDPPDLLFKLPRRRVVMLMVQPERLAVLRENRVERMGTLSQKYATLDFVRQELVYAFELVDRRSDWPIVDMTYKSIEEAAAEVVTLLGLPAD
jgi:hypothetical protein